MGGDSITDIARAALPWRPRREHLAVFGIFSFLWVVFGYGLVRQYRSYGFRSPLLFTSGYLSACCLIGRTQATDTERVDVLLAPLVVTVAAVVLDSWRSKERRLWTWLLGLLYAAIHFDWVTDETAVVAGLRGRPGSPSFCTCRTGCSDFLPATPTRSGTRVLRTASRAGRSDPRGNLGAAPGPCGGSVRGRGRTRAGYRPDRVTSPTPG